MIVSPDVPLLRFTEKRGEKYFELTAEPVRREILPDLFINGWGYNGTIPGPTIQACSGDLVRIMVCNNLPESTSIHWHGLDIPNNMDGVPAVEPSPLIEPGRRFEYRFRITNPPGTHIYHTHVDVARQEMMGLAGGFIVDRPGRGKPGVERDYFIMLQEFSLPALAKGTLLPGAYDLDPLSDSFNFFAMNGRCFPYTTPLAVRYGDRVRIRLANAMMQAHPIHIHGHQFLVSAEDGNAVPRKQQRKHNTALVASGQTRDVQFKADNPGIWPFHCHMPHHNANNFTPPAGGMFTTIVYG